MKKKSNWLKRGCLGGLGLALAAGLVLSPLMGGRQVSAVSSLPYIEQIKADHIAQNKAFTVLEIVPAAPGSDTLTNYGSLGYYAAGSEPCSGWQTKLAAITTPKARDTAAEALFKRLATAGILGSGDGTPLRSTFSAENGYYNEAFAWDSRPVTAATDWTALTLAAPEFTTVKGSFVARGNEAGPYFTKVMEPTLAENTDGSYHGDLNQTIDRLTWYESSGKAPGDCWYYAAGPEAWTVLDLTKEEQLNASLYLYTKADPTPQDTAPDDTYYQCLGQLGNLEYLDAGTVYYTLDTAKLGAPSAAWTAGTPYGVSKDSGYTAASGGYFISGSSEAYRLSDSGEFIFQPSETGAAATVWYSQVYVQTLAGIGDLYTNNQWLLRKVFDISDPDKSSFTIQVTTLPAASVGATQIGAADLVVLSAGQDPVSVSPPAADSDLSADASTLLTAAITGSSKLPVIIDWRLAGGVQPETETSVLRKLAYSLVGTSTNTDHSFVDGNKYCFNAAAPLFPDGSGVAALATAGFGTAFSDAVTQAGFADVLSEIGNENFLRKRAGQTSADLLDEQVSMAAAVRYIINRKGARTLSTLSNVRVLELQPNSNSSQITSADVLLWLNKPSGLTANNIHITTLSMAEFVGHIEDLVENYDLIYVGDSSTGIKTDSSGQTSYNDKAMNGLLYSNIGDKYRASYRLTGMLDTDYSDSLSGSYYKVASGDTARTFRFSGNDLTASKAAALKSFAEAGYPVVLGDKLVTRSSSTASYSFKVNVASAVTGSEVTLTASVAAVTGSLPSGVSYTYQWYQANSTYPYGGAGAKAFIDTASDKDSYYYCVVTAAIGNVTSEYTAESATYHVYQNATPFSASEASDRVAGNYPKSVEKTARLNGITPVVMFTSPQNTASVSYTLSVEPTSSGFPDGSSISYAYQWQRYNSDSWGYVDIDGETSKTLTRTNQRNNYWYRCRITATVSNTTLISPNIIEYNSGEADVYDNGFWWSHAWTTFVKAGKAATQDYEVSTPTDFRAVLSTANASSNSITLVAAPQNTDGTAISGSTPSYQWYKDGAMLTSATSDSLYVNAGGSYYCVVSLSDGSLAARTGTITVTPGSSTAVCGDPIAQYAKNGSFSVTTYSGSPAIDTMHVDRASKVYEALNDILPSDNVVAKSEVTVGDSNYTATAATLYRYLNLSKPTINWVPDTGDSGYPAVYVLGEDGLSRNADGHYYLSYRFSISNPTDATPQTTTYNCYLYVDANSDGLFKSDERLADITVQQDGKTLSPSGGVYRLQAGTTYTVSRRLPDDKVGIIPWKLEIVKNGTESYVHASQQNYTHVSGDTKKTIKVLQILPRDNFATLNLTAESVRLLIQDTKEYIWVPNPYLYLRKDLPDFDIQIEAMYANALNSNSDPGSVINDYDMLIIGFTDAYDKIDKETADAILEFSKSHAVLFTHDTTSICNVPANNYAISDGGGSIDQGGYYWGYDFNTVLRSAVGLDRYGVTDATLGRTNRATSKDSNKHLLSSGRSLELTTENIKKVTNAGYTIAYAPKATKVADLGSYPLTALGQTQGYTRHTLVRYRADARSAQSEPNCTYSGGKYNDNGGYSDGNNTTRQVSQVNKGQITTYPFDLNSTAFGGTLNSALTVAETHEQYYQLNMNGDDIVVWYCLAGGNFSTLPNDATNAYYIYTKGNITYSGAGHNGDIIGTTADSKAQYEQEAKLFINTMVAAFRSVAQQPEVSIVESEDDPTIMTSKYYMADYNNSALDTASFKNYATESDRTIYFRIVDPSLASSGKTTTITYSYAQLNAAGQAVYKTYFVNTDGKIIDENNDVVSDVTLPSFTPEKTGSGLTRWLVLPAPDSRGPLSLLDTGDVTAVRLYITVTTTSGAGAGQVTKTSTASVDLRKIGLFQLN